MLDYPARIALVCMHTSPTATLGRSANGGMNVYVQRVATALADAGIGSDIFTLRHGTDDPQVERLGPLCRVVYIGVGDIPADKYELAELTEPFAAGIVDFATERGLRYDAIYSHYWLSGLAAERLVRAWDAPWVQTAHTLALVKNRQLAPDARPEPALRVAAERMIACRADLLIASTASEADDLIELYGAARERVRVVAPGIDLDTFGPRPKLDARRRLGLEAGPLLLFVGRLERLKGVDILLRALALCGEPRAGLKPRLLILGDDSREGGESERDRLELLAARLEVTDQVQFLGSVAHQELPWYYSAADICLMPSYSESFGLVGLEAQACGCPVVASNVAGLASVVRDGVTGYLVEGDDPGPYADRIRSLVADPLLADQMGRRGILLAQRFPWSRTAARVQDAIESVLKSESASARPVV